MKILFLSRLFYPHIGGVEKHVMQLSLRLIEQGHHVKVITEQFDKSLPKIEKVNGIIVHRISVNKFGNQKFTIWKEMWRLHRLIQQADVIHCHDVFFWYLPFRFLYLHKPVYTTFHGYESYPITKGAIRMRKISEMLSWGNICIGDFIPQWYGTKPTIVSYGAVEIGKSKDKKEKFRNDSALFIGRLDDQTGVLTYAKAVELVRKKFPKFAFTIIGDGPDRKRLERSFKLLGFIDSPEKYLHKYHFAFVSRYLSILEAFAAKRLVFAVYDNPVKEDYLKMAPYAKWIVIVKTPQELAEKIIYYLQHPKEEEALVTKGYAWVKKQSWEHIMQLYKRLWRI